MSRWRASLPAAAAALAAGLAAPGADGSVPLVSARLVEAETRFGMALYRELAAEAPGRNVCVSPASVSAALAMTWNGARGETRQAMARALGLEGMSVEEANRGHAALQAALAAADSAVELTLANSLWLRRGVRLVPEFLRANRGYYGAEVSELDFGDPGAPADVNGWVSRQTRGKITRIVERFEPTDILLLADALYFKGRWQRPFDPERTEERPFTLAGGQAKPVPLMQRAGRFSYCRGADFQAVDLPYGDGRFRFLVFLPDEGSSLTLFQQSLTPEAWQDWLGRFADADGRLGLPRFRLETEAVLNDALAALGMGVALSPGRADFSGIAPPPPNIFIEKVRHKTFVEVNEEGTEAAAVTSVMMGVTSVSPTPPFVMIVDRPFFWAIRDEASGAILFLGSVADPT